MQSTKSTSETERPELSDSDIQWLHETIGIEIFRDYKWNSVDYARVFEIRLEKSEKCQLNARNWDGNTPLHLAAISENHAVINGLLMCGADVNALNNFKQTPITYSQQCSDYSAGFQFFRHLHKLAFLGQHICKENAEWYNKALEAYNQRYPRDGYIAAFTHNPSLTEPMIFSIRAGGEDAIYHMYKGELQKIQRSPIKNRKLGQIVNLTNHHDIPENRLRDLRKYMKYQFFHKTFPIFGFMFKLKYWQTLEHLKSCKFQHDHSSSSPEKSSDLPTKAGAGECLHIEAERCMQQFMPREDTVVVKLMKEIELPEEIDPRKAVDARRSSEYGMSSKEVVNNFNDQQNKSSKPSSNEKLDKLRKLMARLRTQ